MAAKTDLERFRNSLGMYFLACNPKFSYVEYQQKRIIPPLEELERGEFDRLALLVPVGHAKSSIATVDFASWYIGRHPDHNVICLSYSDDFAKDFGRKIRNRLKSPLHQAIFPECRLSQDAHGAQRFATTRGGIFYAFGFNGEVMGKRADCLPGWTLVDTDRGLVRIDELMTMRVPPRIVSYNHQIGLTEYKKLEAVRQTATRELVTIRTADGRHLDCTSNHRVYADGEYRYAHSITKGQSVINLVGKNDTTEMVATFSTDEIPVYDLQVEDNQNFFANGILVHNCVIIDDPLKSEQDARAYAAQRVEFTTSIVKSRLKPNGKVVISFTRICVNDYASKLLDQEADLWTVIKIPAEENGKYLWEEYLGEKHYTEAKRNRRSWAALYMQDPEQITAGPWFADYEMQYYEGDLKPGRFPAYLMVDPALAKHKQADRTSAMIVCTTPEKKILVADWVLDRLNPDERTEAILKLIRKWKPKKFVYEEYGLNADVFHLTKALKEAGIGTRPIPVGRKGPRHMLSKEDRIRELTTEFKEGVIVFPKELKKRLLDGETVDLVRQFRESEYELYAGIDSVLHDEGLDTLSRIHDPETMLRFPDKEDLPYDESRGELGSHYSGSWQGSWESLL